MARITGPYTVTKDGKIKRRPSRLSVSEKLRQKGSKRIKVLRPGEMGLRRDDQKRD